jgi:hypothetical protein
MLKEKSEGCMLRGMKKLVKDEFWENRANDECSKNV